MITKIIPRVSISWDTETFLAFWWDSRTNSRGDIWWQPNLWVPLSKWGRSGGIFWVMASMDVVLWDFCGSCTILVCPSGQSLKTQRNKYKLPINETFNEKKRRHQTRKAKTLENNTSFWNTEKCNSTDPEFTEDKTQWRLYYMCKGVTSGLEKTPTAGSWEVSLFNQICVHQAADI